MCYNSLTQLKSPNIRNNYKKIEIFTSNDDGGRRGTFGFLVSSSGSDSDSDEEGWTLAGECVIVGEISWEGVLGFLNKWIKIL